MIFKFCFWAFEHFYFQFWFTSCRDFILSTSTFKIFKIQNSWNPEFLKSRILEIQNSWNPEFLKSRILEIQNSWNPEFLKSRICSIVFTSMLSIQTVFTKTLSLAKHFLEFSASSWLICLFEPFYLKWRIFWDRWFCVQMTFSDFSSWALTSILVFRVVPCSEL